jgi:hypothetical protein
MLKPMPMPMKKNGLKKRNKAPNERLIFFSRGSRLNAKPANIAPIARENPIQAARAATQKPSPATTSIGPSSGSSRVNQAVTRAST